MNIDIAHQMRTPVRCQQPVHQGLQAVGLPNDDLGVLGEFARFDFHLQQLGGPPNAAQRVLDLVGQVANQFLVGLGLIGQSLFPVLAGLLL